MASVATKPANTMSSTNVSKRQACDECRSRKLACTKEDTGCSRCVRKKVPCHYSEQKPMGRPRKKQCVEDTTDKHVQVLDLGPDSIEPHLDESLLFHDDTSFETPTDATLPLEVSQNETAFIIAEDGRLVWKFGDRDIMPQIDFREDEPVPELDNTPRDTPPDLNIWSGFEHNNHVESEKCSCLASIYLALASLQDLPQSLPKAILALRHAMMSAQACLECLQCSQKDVPIEVLYGGMPPIQGFQSFMMLGTLIPVIANGFKRVIQMIDCEANSASSMGMKMTIDQENFAHPAQTQEMKDCCPAEKMNLENLSPSTWRTILRALVRWDVYGSDECVPMVGLKSLVTRMEGICQQRHESLERLREELQVDVPYPSEKDRLCTKVLEAAKLAMNELIIP